MIRAGIIGTGNIAGVHLRFLKACRGVRIVALCDIKPAALARRQAEYGGRGYVDLHEMLAREALDAVWLCTPPDVRRAPLLDCARRGIPVLCEKPVARQAADARASAQALAKAKARIQVGYVFRSLPIVARLRACFADDAIRTVQSFYGCPMSRERTMAPWFFDKALSGGALIDQATHNFDLLRFLFGDMLEVRGLAHNPVTAKHDGYTIDETIALCMQFKNGIVGTHTHTWLADGWRNEIVLSGEKRLYRLDLGRQVLWVDDGRRVRQHAPKHRGLYYHENAVFLQQLRRDDWRANPSTFADAVRSLELTLACDRAVETGRAVRL